VRRFISKVTRSCGRDDHAGIFDPRDVPQSQRQVAGQTITGLRFEHGLRRERADLGQRFTRTRDVQARDAGEGEPQQRFVLARGRDADVVCRRGKRHVPRRQMRLDVGKLFGEQRTREERGLSLATRAERGDKRDDDRRDDDCGDLDRA
jgi:hypothetical protein